MRAAASRTNVLMITPEALEGYFRRRLSSKGSLTRSERIAAGLSRQTWFVEFDGRALVVRSDQPGGASACPTPLELEYELYRRLADTPVPVARPMWFEHDESVFGCRFYIREFIDGDPNPPGFDDPDTMFDDVRIEASKEHARKMAMVHTIDWGALALDEILPAPTSAADCGTATVDRIADQIARVAREPMPLLDLGVRWLRDQAPASSPAVVLCKGSNGAMQEIWRGGEIVGMSDWELASLGDPANDWARCASYVPTVSGRWDERRLLDYYASLTGYEIPPASMDFYRVVYAFEMLLVGIHSAVPVIEGFLPDARLANLATTTVHNSLDKLARAMELLG